MVSQKSWADLTANETKRACVEETKNVESTVEEVKKSRPTGNETILVVEDEMDVRAYLVKALNRLGYTVLEAADGPMALEVMASFRAIDLLFTDMVLSKGMSGRDVAEAFCERYPASGVLFSSGYARDILDGRGQLDDGMALINKPFRPQDLAKRVREVLDSKE
jgi:CheY-like chemotaxis protein